MICRMTWKFHLNIDVFFCLTSISVYHAEVDEAEAEEVAVVETDELEELLADARRWVDIHRLGDLRLGRHGILYIYIMYMI